MSNIAQEPAGWKDINYLRGMWRHHTNFTRSFRIAMSNFMGTISFSHWNKCKTAFKHALFLMSRRGRLLWLQKKALLERLLENYLSTPSVGSITTSWLADVQLQVSLNTAGCSLFKWWFPFELTKENKAGYAVNLQCYSSVAQRKNMMVTDSKELQWANDPPEVEGIASFQLHMSPGGRQLVSKGFDCSMVPHSLCVYI